MPFVFQVLYSYAIGFVYILIGQVLTAQLWEAFIFCLKVSGLSDLKFFLQFSSYRVLCLSKAQDFVSIVDTVHVYQ